MVSPLHGTFRINVATEFRGIDNCAGVGLIIKDGNSSLIMAKSCILEQVPNACVAEILAIRMALVEAFRRRVSDVELQTDVLGMVAWLQGKCSSVSEAMIIMQDIYLLKLLFAKYKFVAIKKMWNTSCHKLAHYALSNVIPQCWEVTGPPWLDEAFFTDCNSG